MVAVDAECTRRRAVAVIVQTDKVLTCVGISEALRPGSHQLALNRRTGSTTGLVTAHDEGINAHVISGLVAHGLKCPAGSVIHDKPRIAL